MPPEIKSFTITPSTVGIGQSISINAQITQPDAALRMIRLDSRKKGQQAGQNIIELNKIGAKEYTFEQTYSPTVPGIYELVLEVSGGENAQGVIEVKEYSVVSAYAPELTNLTVPPEASSGSDVPCEFVISTAHPLEHGNYVIDWGDGDVKRQKINLNELSQKSGKLTVSHKYDRPGQYKISVYIETPIDSARALTSRKLESMINIIGPGGKEAVKPTIPMPQIEREKAEQKDTAIDLVLAKLELPPEIIVRKRTAIQVFAKSKSTIDVKNCSLILEIGDYKDEQTVSIEAQKDKRITFFWAPDRSGSQKITVTLKCEGDRNLENNSVSKDIEVKQEVSPQLPLEKPETELKKPEEPIVEKKPQEQAQVQECPKEQAQVQEGIIVKLAFLNLPEKIIMGQKTKVEVQAENKSLQNVKNCKIHLEAEDGFKGEKVLTLAANKSNKYVFYWTPGKSGKQNLSVYLQSGPGVNISAERITESVDVNEPEPIDLELTEIILPQVIIVGKKAVIQVVARNSSTTNVVDCSLTLEIGDHKDQKKISVLAQKEKKTTFNWTPDKSGAHKITATLQCEVDKNPKNNSISKDVEVKQESIR